MAIDDELFTEDELHGLWPDCGPGHEEDDGDDAFYPSRQSCESRAFPRPSPEEVASAAAQAALSMLIQDLFRPSDVISARMLSRISSFRYAYMYAGRLERMELPDIDAILGLAGYHVIAVASRKAGAPTGANFRGYPSGSWRFYDLTFQRSRIRKTELLKEFGCEESLLLAKLEGKVTVEAPCTDLHQEPLTPAFEETVTSLPVGLSFEIEYDYPTLERTGLPYRQLYVAATVAQSLGIKRFLIAHNRKPDKYPVPSDLAEWERAVADIPTEDYAPEWGNPSERCEDRSFDEE